MPSNGELSTEVLEIPAKVYPGMFDRELQATVVIRGRAINLIVSGDDVVLGDEPPSEAGASGKIRVFLVDADAEGLLIDLPGEPLGTSRRIRISREDFKHVFTTT